MAPHLAVSRALPIFAGHSGGGTVTPKFYGQLRSVASAGVPLSPWGSLQRKRRSMTTNRKPRRIVVRRSKKRTVDNRVPVRHSKRSRRYAMNDTPHRDPMQEFANRILAE
jgi:hypothetical protein